MDYSKLHNIHFAEAKVLISRNIGYFEVRYLSHRLSKVMVQLYFVMLVPLLEQAMLSLLKHLIFSKAMVQLYFVMLVSLLEQEMLSLMKHPIFSKAMAQLYFVMLVPLLEQANAFPSEAPNF